MAPESRPDIVAACAPVVPSERMHTDPVWCARIQSDAERAVLSRVSRSGRVDPVTGDLAAERAGEGAEVKHRPASRRTPRLLRERLPCASGMTPAADHQYRT